jgi:hypothetical protein
MQVQLNVNNSQKDIFLDFVNTFMNNNIVKDYTILQDKNDTKFKSKEDEMLFYSSEFKQMAEELKEATS